MILIFTHWNMLICVFCVPPILNFHNAIRLRVFVWLSISGHNCSSASGLNAGNWAEKVNLGFMCNIYIHALPRAKQRHKCRDRVIFLSNFVSISCMHISVLLSKTGIQIIKLNYIISAKSMMLSVSSDLKSPCSLSKYIKLITNVIGSNQLVTI